METGRVLVTGATGYVAQQVLPALQARYETILTDVDSRLSSSTLPTTQGAWDAAGQEVEGIHELDLIADDGSGLRALMEGVDAVVHLAFKPPVGHDGTGGDLLGAAQSLYEGERDNIDMAQRIYQAALELGVRRVVMGSSNQAAKWYEVPYFQGLKQTVSPEDIPKPDNFYGWAKASYELLGFLYACGTLGRQLEVVQLRIVAPRPIELKGFVGATRARYFRDIAAYLSPRDLTQLVERAIDTPDIRDEHGVPWLVVYGVSNNDRRFWSLENARRVLGYAPQDNSEVVFADDIRRVLDSGAEVITEELVNPS
jgi:hypothetical protein